MSWRRIILLAALPLLVPAARADSKQDQADAVVRALLGQDVEVATVGYRLVTGNAAQCAKGFVETGATLGTLAQYDAPYRAAAARVLGMTNRPTVELVVPQSAAEQAGIKPGDVLIAADGLPFAASPPSAGASFTPVEAAMDTLDKALADGRATVTVDRAGQLIAIELVGAPACQSRFQISIDELDAFGTDTIWIKLSSAMVDFARTPDALAAVMAHELAHNVLGHHKTGIGPEARRAQELAADRLAPYLMAGAGYDPAAAVVLYRRFKAKHLGGLFTSPTYPGWGQRVKAIEAEVARIADLRARGEPILPPTDLRPR
ncbi:MAG: hypothetical protein E7773_03820 [Sphingomonas sp.]|uniref:M48 family metallopeptidase n=1 Tax=Sphingomonas sp. TaxID=28214 RepID=UPI0011F5DF2F|nr:M48 family metallopeptidase [Sphingomonas sp.]THD37175.1 MAG: hypothetical protein E7773_03820 [Sphingomonas sp.]